MNPHIEFFDCHNWGYSVVEFTPDACTYVGYAVDKTVNSPEADRSVVAAYRVPEGEVSLENVTPEFRT
jgi:alkaline phosphatase D